METKGVHDFLNNCSLQLDVHFEISNATKIELPKKKKLKL
jgi:hypothetical protein